MILRGCKGKVKGKEERKRDKKEKIKREREEVGNYCVRESAGEE